jgi:hypothetical protein
MVDGFMVVRKLKLLVTGTKGFVNALRQKVRGARVRRHMARRRKREQLLEREWCTKMQPLIDYWSRNLLDRGLRPKTEVFIPWDAFKGLRKVKTVNHNKRYFDELDRAASRKITKKAVKATPKSTKSSNTKDK